MDAASFNTAREHGEIAVSAEFFKILTLFFLGAIAIGVLTHAKGFSMAAGTVFTGVNGLGRTLEGH